MYTNRLDLLQAELGRAQASLIRLRNEVAKAESVSAQLKEMISEEDGSLREMRDAAERKRLKAEEKRAAEHDRRERLKKGWTDHYQPPLTEAEKLVRKQRRWIE